MKAIGFIGGGASGDLLLESIERCIEEHACERVYLLRPSVKAELADAAAPDLIDIALEGSPQEIDALLIARRRSRLLQQAFIVPEAPTKTIELLGDRLVVLTAERGALEEEDILSANAVLFGDADGAFARLFGPRIFASPGNTPGTYGVLSRDARGLLAVKILSSEGACLAACSAEGSGARFSILS